jgi:hypothetical protein
VRAGDNRQVMEEEMAIVKASHYRAWESQGGQVKEGIGGGVDRWSVCHGTEVGGSAAVHAWRRQCSVGLGRKKVVTPPPPQVG